MGAKYGIPFPVFARAAFGPRGAIFVALIRGFVGVGWFSFLIYVGGTSVYVGTSAIIPALSRAPYLSDIIGLNLWQLACILLSAIVTLLIALLGINYIKYMEMVAAPVLLISSIALMIWAIVQTGFVPALEATYELTNNSVDVTQIGAQLTAMIGSWSTMMLNIMDFTRYSKNQYDQAVGQVIFPFTITGFAFIGILVTGASFKLYGKAIWNPSDLFAQFSSPWVILLASVIMAFAVMSGNLAANLVSAANDFANVHPKYITFRRASVVTCVLALLLFPWKLFHSAAAFIFGTLIYCSHSC